MKFEDRHPDTCAGWQLAHSLLVNEKRFLKAHCLTREDIDLILTTDIKTISVFQLDETDIDEDTAALRAASLLAGDGLVVQHAGKGRANLFAKTEGVFLPDKAIDHLNRADDAFSVASIEAMKAVQEGQLVATIKIVPYGMPEALFKRLTDMPKACIKPFKPYHAALITTEDISTKTAAVLRGRLERTKGTLSAASQTAHNRQQLATEIEGILQRENAPSLLLLLGAAAITDKRDVLPAAVTDAGGTIVKIGLPTDPGNLLMLAHYHGTTIIGLPGCARSPAFNGFDWVLERFAAQLPLDRQALGLMGVGGLLKEGADRPVSRLPHLKSKRAMQPPALKLAAIILAAGSSSRSGKHHKLLARLGGEAVIKVTTHKVARALQTSPIVVTGSKDAEIRHALKGCAYTPLYHPDYEAGMGTSLAAAIRAVPQDADYALVCLGDMPFVSEETLQNLVMAATENAAAKNGKGIIVPTLHGKNGHPVLWHRRHFPALMALTGDKGGKGIMQENAHDIAYIDVSDPGILIDLDTPEMLAQFGLPLS